MFSPAHVHAPVLRVASTATVILPRILTVNLHDNQRGVSFPPLPRVRRQPATARVVDIAFAAQFPPVRCKADVRGERAKHTHDGLQRFPKQCAVLFTCGASSFASLSINLTIAAMAVLNV